MREKMFDQIKNVLWDEFIWVSAKQAVWDLNIVNINFFCLSIRIDNFGSFDLFNWGLGDNGLFCNDLAYLGRIIESNFILIGILNIFIKYISFRRYQTVRYNPYQIRTDLTM